VEPTPHARDHWHAGTAMTGRASNGRAARFPWARWTQERLLDVRLKDLGHRLEGTWLTGAVATLYAQLARREVRLRPHVWLSHDWYSPEGVPGIGMPFFLAHPRLLRLERQQMLEVEGGTWEDCLRILRHETGHAIQHAYRLQRRKKWRDTFGRSTTPYPERYRPNPASRRFVQHLRLYYAQSHPDEDFAETFAVWMQPRATWRRRYAGWPALRKLEYVDELMAELSGVTPPVRTRRHVDPVNSLGHTLRTYYTRKKEQYAVSFPDAYDEDLRRIFSDDPKLRHRERASRFIGRYRTDIRRTVARWTGEHEYAVELVLNDMIGRCRELKLHAVGSDRQLLFDFSGVLAVRTVHFLYNRRAWIAL
jgi:hypothetical protein